MIVIKIDMGPKTRASSIFNGFSTLLSFLFLLAACNAGPNLTQEEETALLFATLTQSEAEGLDAIRSMVDSGSDLFIAPLIDLYWAGQIGINDWSGEAETLAALEQLSGEQPGEAWADWVNWYSGTDINPPAEYKAWKGALFAELDPDFGEFFVAPVAADFRLEEIVWGGVAKDGIPALDDLEQIPIAEADGYTPRDIVFGISINGDSRAYPLRIMDWHEMANDVVGGVPLSIAYCTLCGSAIAYRAERQDGSRFDFGSSGLLYRSNKLMYDRQTNTLWNQLTGLPVMGPLVGEVDRLEILPIVITSLEEWAEAHPDSTILPMETGFFRDYTAGAAYGEYFVDDGLIFPVGEVDPRLPPKAQVFALEVDGLPKAYPLTQFRRPMVVNDRLAQTDIVLISEGGDRNVYGYSYELEYITYSAGVTIRAYEAGERRFDLGPDGGLVDQDGSPWEITEAALIGPSGQTLPRLGGHVAYWFGWSTFFPETELYNTE